MRYLWVVLLAACWQATTLSPQPQRRSYVKQLAPEYAAEVGEGILQGVPAHGMSPQDVHVMLDSFFYDQVRIQRINNPQLTVESWTFEYPWKDGLGRKICGLTFENGKLRQIRECSRL